MLCGAYLLSIRARAKGDFGAFGLTVYHGPLEDSLHTSLRTGSEVRASVRPEKAQMSPAFTLATLMFFGVRTSGSDHL